MNTIVKSIVKRQTTNVRTSRLTFTSHESMRHYLVDLTLVEIKTKSYNHYEVYVYYRR